MRLAVLSDIHGNLTALEAALADLAAAGGADRTWVLGDLAAFGPRPTECVRCIQALVAAADADDATKGSVCVISGNTDRYLVRGERPRQPVIEKADDYAAFIAQMKAADAGLRWGLEQLSFTDYEFLVKLGDECGLDADSYGYVIGYHGVPGDDEGVLSPDSTEEEAADALLDREGRLGIGGHIHRQMDRQLVISAWRALNVGSIGLSVDQPGKAQWGLLTFADGDVQVDLRAVPYDVEAVIADLTAVGYPAVEWTASRLRHGQG
ncbi:MAG: hypothetical protein GYB67_05005 [Chloroflexi bacterium]|nr:hypothetical protein [Chloroflexota bacterium]